jgi:hypothetical protein
MCLSNECDCFKAEGCAKCQDLHRDVPHTLRRVPVDSRSAELRAKLNTRKPEDIAGSSFIVRDGQMVSITPGTAVAQLNDTDNK